MIKITKEDIYTLALNNPVVHICVTYYQRGDMTFEQAMMLAVSKLVEINEKQFEMIVDQMNKSVVRYSIEK